MRPRNLIGIEWIEGTGDETFGWIDNFETEKGVVFIDLPLTMTIEHDFLAWDFRPAHVKVVVHWESKVWAPKTLVAIRLRSSMKARSKGNVVLLVVNLGILTCIEYSNMMFIPAKKGIIERVQPAKIPCWCLRQALVADSENDLLKTTSCYVSISLIHCGETSYLCRAKTINVWDRPISVCNLQPYNR